MATGIHFLGIGGSGASGAAAIAEAQGFQVTGCDLQPRNEFTTIFKTNQLPTGHSPQHLASHLLSGNVDILAVTPAIFSLDPNNPELLAAKEKNIPVITWQEFVGQYLAKDKFVIAICGTHGKTTTTTMVIWLFKQLGIPISYSVGAKISFGDMGHFDPASKYFVYECDEYDRNFLSFEPAISIIPGIDYDHPDIYPTREEYYKAFNDFFCQSKQVFAHPEDYEKIGLAGHSSEISLSDFTLTGEVNRKNALLVVEAIHNLTGEPVDKLIEIADSFPGVSRRFEKIAENIYTDYAHTPEKIRGALQLAHEVAGENIAVVYEGLHNTRQHFIKGELVDLFDGVKKLYVVPSYLAREDKDLELLTPEKLCEIIRKPANKEPSQLDKNLKTNILDLASQGTLVLCLTAGGGGSLDEWLRQQFINT